MKKEDKESIVKECINIMEKNFAGSATSESQKETWGFSANTFKAWNNSIKFSRDQIKQHFGLK
jgi:hypothetical protein